MDLYKKKINGKVIAMYKARNLVALLLTLFLSAVTGAVYAEVNIPVKQIVPGVSDEYLYAGIIIVVIIVFLAALATWHMRRKKK